MLDPLDQSASQVQIQMKDLQKSQMKARFVQQHGQMHRAKQTNEDEVVVILELEVLSQSLESFLLSPLGSRFIDTNRGRCLTPYTRGFSPTFIDERALASNS